MSGYRPLVLRLALGLCLSCGPAAAAAQTAGNPLTPPNIVLINLDDADSGLMTPRMLANYYPNIGRLAETGMTMTNLHATTPFCSASRAALMTGKYAFRNQVRVNEPNSPAGNGFPGGYSTFLAEGHEQQELGVWLKSAGYRTMHVGKYHHHDFDFRVPAGWDEFHVTLGMRYYGTYRFSNREFPAGQMTRNGLDEYVTDVDAAEAVRLIENQDQRSEAEPYFLYVAPIAPHYPEGPGPEGMVDTRKYADFAADETIPLDPDWNEADFSDKPAKLRLPALSADERELMQREYLSRVRAMKSVDDLVGRIVAAIEASGEAENTYLFLTSDNGYQLGHHRTSNKLDPFDRSTRVPLFVSGPGVPAGQGQFLLAQLDLCPTILELAGVTTMPDVDGKSFAPLLHAPQDHSEVDWQRSIMIENWQTKRFLGRTYPTVYTALRYFDSVYVAWANGASEYYDLASDPFQLQNLYPQLPPPFQEQLADDLSAFRQSPVEPLTTFAASAYDEPLSGFLDLEGFSEDDTRLKEVALVVRSYLTGQFYNGVDWQPDWTAIQVVPERTDAPITRWDFFGFVEPPNGLPLDYLVVTARGFDEFYHYPLDVAWTVRPIDVAAPEAFFDSDQPDVASGGAAGGGLGVTLQGGIRDDYLIDTVRIVIRNSQTGAYFNGRDWQSEWTYLPAELLDARHWRLNATLPAGPYVASVRALDGAGNWQIAPDIVRFQLAPAIEPPAPPAVITFAPEK